jgi:hypothetical protein
VILKAKFITGRIKAKDGNRRSVKLENLISMEKLTWN